MARKACDIPPVTMVIVGDHCQVTSVEIYRQVAALYCKRLITLDATTQEAAILIRLSPT